MSEVTGKWRDNLKEVLEDRPEVIGRWLDAWSVELGCTPREALHDGREAEVEELTEKLSTPTPEH